MRVFGVSAVIQFSEPILLALIVAEPIVTVLSSPLLVDLYSTPALAETCNKSYVLFVDILLTLITVSSIITSIMCLKNILNLSTKSKNKIKASLNKAFMLTFCLNFVMTLKFVSGVSRGVPKEEIEEDSCWHGFRAKTSWSIGFKFFIPQLLLCVTLLVVAVCFCMSRRIPDDEDDPSYDDQNIIIGIFLPILSIFFFQMVCFVFRFSFTVCTCGWYTLLSRRFGETLKMCFLKSVCLMLGESLLLLYLRRRRRQYTYTRFD